MTKPRRGKVAKTWGQCAPHVIGEIHEYLRVRMHAAVDQAERFRDRASQHHDEDTARRWEEAAQEYRDALASLTMAAKRTR